MSELALYPADLNGKVTVPSSKSIGHRVLIASALAGERLNDKLSWSDDLSATANGIDQLMTLDTGMMQIDCGESGSTLRFLLPLALVLGKDVTFTCRGRLGQRPLQVYYGIMDRQKISCYADKGRDFSLRVKGQLRPDSFVVPGNISSQYVSGLLMALPLLQGDSQLKVAAPVESESYIRLTLGILHDYGIKVERKGDFFWSIPGKQKYRQREYIVEGDYSQGAFWLAAGLLSGPVTVCGLTADSIQGDAVCIKIMRQMGADIRFNDDGSLTAYPSKLQGITIDVADCPDLVPVLSVLAALSHGTTRIINAERLRLKESDRLAALASELSKMGGRIQETDDGLIIDGVKEFHGTTVSSWQDHRIAMCLAVAALRCDNMVRLENWECVNKSYPKFWDDYKSLGGRCE